jgi:pSer/pThr/pTyr-binding forkhead associated (FHA) protein
VLAEGVTPFALSALKYGLFALLFLFIWRSMRWVLRGLTVDTAPRASRTRNGKGAEPTGPTLPPGASRVSVTADGARPRMVAMSLSMVIGRGEGCEVPLDDTYVSQQHARIFGKNDVWYVEDLGSTNGTYVNDQRLAAPAMLQAGDRIRVGTTILEPRR